MGKTFEENYTSKEVTARRSGRKEMDAQSSGRPPRKGDSDVKIFSQDIYRFPGRRKSISIRNWPSGGTGWT